MCAKNSATHDKTKILKEDSNMKKCLVTFFMFITFLFVFTLIPSQLFHVDSRQQAYAGHRGINFGKTADHNGRMLDEPRSGTFFLLLTGVAAFGAYAISPERKG